MAIADNPPRSRMYFSSAVVEQSDAIPQDVAASGLEKKSALIDRKRRLGKNRGQTILTTVKDIFGGPA